MVALVRRMATDRPAWYWRQEAERGGRGEEEGGENWD